MRKPIVNRSRLLILVEGETEEMFVKELLAPHLHGRGFESVSAKLMGNARLRSHRGGVRGWPEVKNEILRHLRADPSLFVATMVDYYGMPGDPNKPKAWPGRHEATAAPYAGKAPRVEGALSAEIQAELGDARRFIPFVLMHEFEALLFSECRTFAKAIEREELAHRLQEIRDKYNSPEEVNDSPATHPSRRIVELVPNYQKPIYGNIAALEIGLERIRSECPHFRAWLERLEQVI
ncbi:MAG: DUF4276 family protein [Isosphaeraceae bacterium]